MSNGFMQRFKGKILVPAGSLFQFGKGAAAGGPQGNVFVFQSAVGAGNTNDTTEDTLATFALPANTLDLPGRALWIYAFGSFANNAHSKTAKLYFGSEAVSTGANTTTGGIGWALELLVIKTGSNTQQMSGQIVAGATHGGCTTQAGAETDTSAITIKVTGQTGTAAASDVLLNGVVVTAMD